MFESNLNTSKEFEANQNCRRTFLIGITEGIVKGICKVIQVTLPRYRDNSSQILVKELIVQLLKLHPEWTLRNFVGVLGEIAAQHKNVVST